MQLTFYKGFSMSTVNITIHWVGQTFEGQNINHPIDVIAPVTGMYMIAQKNLILMFQPTLTNLTF